MSGDSDLGKLINLLSKSLVMSSETDFCRQLVGWLVELFNADSGGVSFFLNGEYNIGDVFVNAKNSDLLQYSQRFSNIDPMSPPHYILQGKKTETATRSVLEMKDASSQTFKDFLENMDVYYTLFLFAKYSSDMLAVISLNRSHKQLQFSEDEVERLNRIAEVITEALGFNLEYNQLNTNVSLLMSAPLQEGVVFIDHRFRVISYNQQARYICDLLECYEGIEELVKVIFDDLLYIGKNRRTVVTPDNQQFQIEIVSYLDKTKPMYLLMLLPDKSEMLNQITDLAQLTKKEKKIAVLMGRGFSNKEIADSLVISENTVKAHIKNIFGKMGVNSRTSFIAKILSARE